MSAEHESRSHEQVTDSAEVDQLAKERLEQLKDQPERSSEQDPNKRAELARETIAKHEAAPEPAAKAGEQEGATGFSARLSHLTNYQQTLASVQRRLSPSSRSFSKVIHSPVVEKTSEVVGKTVMRPSVTLGATVTALVVGGFFYFTARHYGFRLSGTGLLLSLILGGILGVVIEAIAKSAQRLTRR
jgi:flagellar biosynthesis/type III secretory pathway protein FliH